MTLLMAKIEIILKEVAQYERWRVPGEPPEPCDFCHNTTEHMPDCPVTLAREVLRELTREH